MTPAEIEAMGREHYGHTWVPRLAADLGVSRHTVYAWRSGKNPVTAQAANNLAQLRRKLRRRNGKVRQRVSL